MRYLILGLILFLGAHSVRIFAEDWRTRTIARLGPYGWKGVYTLVSIAGFALLVWGYGQARLTSGVLYDPPLLMRHVASLLMLVSFVLVAAAYVPGNHIKAALGHPMVAGVKLWAFAHLLSNGGMADVMLFGAFLAWAIVDFIVARRRDRAAGTRYAVGSGARTLLTAIAGAVAWAVFAWWAHLWLIGVRPLG
ncbi:MAG: NnrU family protein [Pseudomonadota bacterium]